MARTTQRETRERVTKPAGNVSPTATAAPAPPSSDSERADKPNRLSIPLDANGRPALDRMQDEKRRKLLAILRDEDFAKSAGIIARAETSEFPPLLIGPIIKAISQLEALILARMTKADPEIIRAVALYTPEESAMIAEPLQAVLNKYGSGLLTKYGDEAALLMLLGMNAMQKLEAIRAAQAAKASPNLVTGDFAPRVNLG